MEALTLINGNKQPYTVNMPKLVILAENINTVALAHIKENTRLDFKDAGPHIYEAQPETAAQIAALLLTYNFKTRYYNNWQTKNTIFLKFDHHVGFDVDSICLDCCQHNGIHTDENFTAADRLAC